MAEIIEGVHPTRTELLEIKKQIELASKGHQLLREKNDAMAIEFFEVEGKARNVRSELFGMMNHAYSNLIKTEATMGSSEVETIAKTIEEMQEPKVTTENIMGVRVPRLSFETEIHKKASQPYGFSDTTSALDDTIEDYNKVLKQIITLTETEETLRRLSNEIKKTKRRVNALEYLMIPRLKNTRKYIRMRLEEIERENFMRLKLIKNKNT